MIMRSKTVERFNLANTLECGQTFSWIREGRGFINADLGKVVYVEQRENRLLYESSKGPVNLTKLFRLDDPIDEIHREIMLDQIMKRSIEFAPDLRIVNDSFFPCLVSFISSTYKNIPAIRKIVWNIRKRWGPAYEFRGKTYYGLPTPDQLMTATVKDLEREGLGYRAKYLKQTTEAVANGLVTEEELREMTYSAAHAKLRSLSGVGDKVADCVALFSLGFLEAFPIDIWIERVIQEHYDIFTRSGKSYARKSSAAREYFGRYSGYAQQYLYHFSRSTGKV
jgi:N-glycosylase/DNA lyase